MCRSHVDVDADSAEMLVLMLTQRKWVDGMEVVFAFTPDTRNQNIRSSDFQHQISQWATGRGESFDYFHMRKSKF